MTTNISFASGDGHLRSSSSSYASANTGSNLTVFGTGNVRMGQDKVSTTYFTHEAFFAYPYTRDTSAVVVAAYFDFFVVATYGTSLAKNWGVRMTPWGTLDTGDWKVIPGGITALTPRVGYAGAVNSVQNRHVFAAEETLNNHLNDNSGTMQIIVYNDRMTSEIPPTGAEYSDIRTVETGASTDPTMIWTTQPLHTLLRVGGCQVQLSTGDHVYIEADGGGDIPLLTLKRHDGTSASNIATNLLSSARDMGSSNQAFQSYALARDNSDNLYWVGHAGGGGNTLNIVTWKKTGATSWQEMAFRQTDLVGFSGVINNIGAAWHNVGVGGTLMIVAGHEPGGLNPDPTSEMSYALINCDRLLTGGGTLVRASGSALSVSLVPAGVTSTDHNQPINPVGNGLDVAALPNSNTRGIVVCHSRRSRFGSYSPVGIARYQLNSTSAVLDYVHTASQELWATKDAGAKVRVLPISESRFAVVTLDMDPGWGPTIYIIQNMGTSTDFSTLGSVLLHGEGIASLPTPANIDDVPTWDALYQPEENMIWFYYFDTASQYRLMRTGFDLDTYKAVKNEIQVSASVVGSGTNTAIRVQRGRLTESEALIAVANRSGGGAQTTTYVVDKLNVSPLAPTLVDKTNYDATQAGNFDWTFNDPNVGDSQTAFQLQIENADTQVVVHDTGKITSVASDRTVAGGVLTNGVNYRWRVRTYDTSDSAGAWSGYDFFVTSAGGTATITFPAADNPTPWLEDSVTITWSTSGITQTAYRVRVVRVSTGVQVSDTGFITSTATSRTVTGLLSDVEYRIELTVRNAALISSNTAIRLITPDYNEPEIPDIGVSALDDQGYTLVTITNPAPQGDRPVPTHNLVQRKKSTESTWVTIAMVPVNGEYRDYATASGDTYQYRVQAVASVGFIESAVYEVTLQLMGVWLHRPYDPEGSSKQYMYGANQRGDQHQSFVQLTRYAGREFPVADFAHYHDDITSVTVNIPFGDTYRQDIEDLKALEASHETLVLRDNRGRHSFGVILGLAFTDTALGSDASWDHQHVDYDEDVTT